MNKKIVLLIFLILLFVTSIVYNMYSSSEQNLKSTLSYYKKYTSIAQNIYFLKKKYSSKNIRIIKKYCKTVSDTDTYILNCRIPVRHTYIISSFLKSNVKLKSFSIDEKNNSILFSAEIYK